MTPVVAPAEMSKRSKRWNFTLHNPNVDDYSTMFNDGGYASYAMWQVERSDFVTVVGYVEMHRQASLSRMERLVPRAFFEICRGVLNQSHYLMILHKSQLRVDGPWEIGTKFNQGKRTDLKPFPLVTNDTSNSVVNDEVEEAKPGVYEFADEVLHFTPYDSAKVIDDHVMHRSTGEFQGISYSGAVDEEGYNDNGYNIGSLQADAAQEQLDYDETEYEHWDYPDYAPEDEDWDLVEIIQDDDK